MKKEQNGRESLRRLKPIVGFNASKRRKKEKELRGEKKERKNSKLNKAEDCNRIKEKYKAKKMIETDFFQQLNSSDISVLIITAC